MRFFTTLACMAVASGAAARKIQTVGWDKYAEERGFAGYDDPMENAKVDVREPDAEATQAWEQAHGGKAPVYKAYGEDEDEHGRLAARMNDRYHGHFIPRDVPDFGDEDVDTSAEGYDLEARSEHAHGGKAPAYKGYSEDEHGELHTRWTPVFDEDVDTSLEDYGEHGIHARSQHEWEDEESKWRSASHHSEKPSHTAAWSEQTAWTKPTHIARAIKDAWEHYSGKGEEAAEEPKHQHYARNAKGKLVYTPMKHAEVDYELLHSSLHYAREAEAAYAHGFREGMAHSYKSIAARNAEAHDEPASAHRAAHPSASRTAWKDESESWIKATKTANPSKTGGWGIPW